MVEHALARFCFTAAACLALGTLKIAAAQSLTIQGSSTFISNILTPNQSEIERISGQSLKIVGIRSDIGLLRSLGRPRSL